MVVVVVVVAVAVVQVVVTKDSGGEALQSYEDRPQPPTPGR